VSTDMVNKDYHNVHVMTQMPVTHHFSGLGSAVSLVHVACVFVRPDNNFKLNDRLSRYVAR